MNSGRRFSSCLSILVALTFVALAPGATSSPAGPAGKLYIAGVNGKADVMTNGKIVPLSLKDIFLAAGAQIDTAPKGDVTMVFSNGTGVFLDHATRIEVRRFTQEPFQASRTDLELEPSVSHTEIRVAYGRLAISTSKLLEDSTLLFVTELGSFELRGGNLVVEVSKTEVKFFLLAGNGTLKGRYFEGSGHRLTAGEEVVILPVPPSQANAVTFSQISPAGLSESGVLVEQAYTGRRTVFFQTGADNDINPVTVVPVSLPVNAAVSPSQLPH